MCRKERERLAARGADRADTRRYCMYVALSSVADYATATVPITKVNPDVDQRLPPHEFMSDHDRKNYENCELHCPLGVTGEPCGEKRLGLTCLC